MGGAKAFFVSLRTLVHFIIPFHLHVLNLQRFSASPPLERTSLMHEMELRQAVCLSLSSCPPPDTYITPLISQQEMEVGVERPSSLLSDILMKDRHRKVLHPNHPWIQPAGLIQERKVGQQDVKTKHARKMNGTPQKNAQVYNVAATLWRGSTPPQRTSTATHVDQRLTCFSAPCLRERAKDGHF
ncbi:hypothetical protein IRJ41_018279 [Triplophysa rosa]|uniref:Uncharacterized protein n=1 Tax=Triplophysa rosa TaxID=992332 RepID=A0A9W7TQJ3_TRIRA|nr:hypothetical protein IRJ41_018279 [Triplophysa rosa]